MLGRLDRGTVLVMTVTTVLGLLILGAVACKTKDADRHTRTEATVKLSDMWLPEGIVPPEGYLETHPLAGVLSGPAAVDGSVDLTDGYREIGVSDVRTHEFHGPFDVSAIDPGFDAVGYDFDSTEHALERIADGPHGVLLRIGESTPLEGSVPLPTVTELPGWHAAIHRIVERLHLEWPAEEGRPSPLSVLELWNEPDSGVFWDRTPAAFATELRNFARVVAGIDPGLLVGAPTLSQGSAENAAWWSQFVAQYVSLYDSTPPNPPELREHIRLDFLPWKLHTDLSQSFVDEAKVYFERADYLSRELDEQEFEVYVTSWGIESDPDTQLGAAIMTSNWTLMQSQRRLYKAAGEPYRWIAEAFYATGNDTDHDLEDPGLFHRDGTPKIGALAFSMWTKFAEETSSILESELSTSTADGKGTALYYVGAHHMDGGYSVLICNRGPETDVDFQFVDPNAETTADRAVVLRLVTEAYLRDGELIPETELKGPNRQKIELKTNDIALVRLEPGE